MIMKSKIKTLFNEELRRQIAAVCDTRRIESNQEKMDLLQRLLHRANIQVDQLGGATNRFVGMIDGYAVKFAVDRQGYKDNLMEYALSSEMQPYVTKSYETNGYILVQECVRILTLEEWRIRKTEIIKILDILGREYLLGDVGYFDVNMTNWGIRDSGDIVILDYAYCHRLTEDLFTCSVCGSILTYDQNFVNILCTDRANCHEKYSYNQIKARQGDAIDWNTIEERKHNSVMIPEGKDSVIVEQDSDLLLDSRTFVIRNYRDLARYKEVKNNMVTLDYTDPDVLDKMLKLTMAKVTGDTERIEELESEIEAMKKEPEEIRCVVDPEFQERMDEDAAAEYEAMLYGYDYDPSSGKKKKEKEEEEDLSQYSFESLMDRLRASTNDTNIDTFESESDSDTATDDTKTFFDDFEGDTMCVVPIDSNSETVEESDIATDEQLDSSKEFEQEASADDAPLDNFESDDTFTNEPVACGSDENPDNIHFVPECDDGVTDPEEVIFDNVSLMDGFNYSGDNDADVEEDNDEK